MASSALVQLLANPTFELLPLGSATQRAALLPPGATISIAASPSRPLEATVAVAEALASAGFAVVPHLAARMVRDRTHLLALLDRLDAAGIRRAFVVAGDAPTAGAFPDGVSLLAELSALRRAPTEIGIPCYPDGHPAIADERLAAALAAKAPMASYMTTQLCFDPRRISAWVTAQRAAGLTLPVHIGLPGAVELTRLLRIATRIGVRDAHRFALRHGGLLRRLLRPGGYRPDALLLGLAPLLADPGADIRGLHFYTFNEVGPTEAWRRSFLARRSGQA